MRGNEFSWVLLFKMVCSHLYESCHRQGQTHSALFTGRNSSSTFNDQSLLLSRGPRENKTRTRAGMRPSPFSSSCENWEPRTQPDPYKPSKRFTKFEAFPVCPHAKRQYVLPLCRNDIKQTLCVPDNKPPKSIVMLGDSTLAEHFVSLSSLLGADTSRNHKTASVLTGVRSKACGGNLTIDFIRDDLLALSTLVYEGHNKKWKAPQNAHLLGEEGLCRASQASLLIVTAGTHYGRYYEENRASPQIFGAVAGASISKLIRLRTALGHSPRTTVLLGPRTPVANCTAYLDRGPIHAQTYQDSLVDDKKFSLSWQHHHFFNFLMHYIAVDQGATFVPIALSSAQRPDSTIGNLKKKKSNTPTDCVHHCLPGPQDAWNEQIFWALNSPPYLDNQVEEYESTCRTGATFRRLTNNSAAVAEFLATNFSTHDFERMGILNDRHVNNSKRIPKPRPPRASAHDRDPTGASSHHRNLTAASSQRRNRTAHRRHPPNP